MAVVLSFLPCLSRLLDGALYAATVNNFLGTEPIISRATENPAELIRTETSVTWLNGAGVCSQGGPVEQSLGLETKGQWGRSLGVEPIFKPLLRGELPG